ncbi:hypothetical protein [Candidatus Methanosphaera massiliense]|jgi:hypothetical protein|uniref:hypothetical protein n=1 Tax=Methanosphaera TaxID=2316 RepID=UPI000DC5D693|nr:hypothetical protein [Candidatus Methanosphaera massiliense]MDD6286563.1 hypothetical protein [Methanobacteriaceae archaeon]MDE4078793.1 hypothetical protein [Candidatus Methanosphaera massiliense]MDY2744947.1 hypothetical protein [Methanosphaera sp.]RAP45181.1 MAG: hypothetical protein BZ134_01630 [Methanosphaera sp. SHI1033]
MNIEWFYIAIVLACSDELHGIIWHTFSDFYIIFGEMVYNIVQSSFITWITHEVLEAIFHVIILTLVFQSPTIGILAGAIHLVIDLYHNYFNLEMTWLQHRSLHFVIESIFFMIILAM